MNIFLLVLACAVSVLASDHASVVTASEIETENQSIIKSAHFGDKYEAIYANSGWSFVELDKQVGRFVIGGNVFGFHNGIMGAASFSMPVTIGKNLLVSPGFYLFMGTHETGPGFGTHWEFRKGFFSTEGLTGWYSPVQKKSTRLQFVGDPVDIDVRPFHKWGPTKLQNILVGYSGEFGRYGKYGTEADRFHAVQATIPAGSIPWMKHHSARTEFITSYVPGHSIVRFGLRIRPGGEK